MVLRSPPLADLVQQSIKIIAEIVVNRKIRLSKSATILVQTTKKTIKTISYLA